MQKSDMCYSPIKINNNLVPCRCCASCRKKRANDTKFLMMTAQKSIKGSSFFFTLTYDDNNLPYSESGYPTLKRKDITLFFDRLKKWFKRHYNINIFYLYCGEYGKKTNRPHYHSICYTDSSISLEVFQKVIKRCWQKCVIFDFQEIKSDGCVDYLTKYLTKPHVYRHDTLKEIFSAHHSELHPSFLYSISDAILYNRGLTNLQQRKILQSAGIEAPFVGMTHSLYKLIPSSVTFHHSRTFIELRNQVKNKLVELGLLPNVPSLMIDYTLDPKENPEVVRLKEFINLQKSCEYLSQHAITACGRKYPVYINFFKPSSYYLKRIYGKDFLHFLCFLYSLHYYDVISYQELRNAQMVLEKKQETYQRKLNDYF